MGFILPKFMTIAYLLLFVRSIVMKIGLYKECNDPQIIKSSIYFLGKCKINEFLLSTKKPEHMRRLNIKDEKFFLGCWFDA